ncbi:sugar-phosphatase [Vagococcus xieshaowenii]|uniref:Sugar-phosphatase n=1 Tax=Vagococcus xieshaowenii TaxID=2562451 RepID=A0A4Z0D7Q5_9ENTE|nr:sugar-phosphatase [Vagococcus xieshaowenii]QCA29086.1 sugar-phosphatase [Vagococcus xieshaowenii]TFZ40938.1 sugar-phosphatase [Vagococcus xieshaowenii]
MSIKLVAIDIDGTLINSNHQLTEKTIEVIKKKAAEGMKIVIASGRPLIGMLEVVEQLGLTTEHDYIISYNGALAVKAHNHEPFVEHSLTYDDLVSLNALSKEVNAHYHYADLEAIYTPHRRINPYSVHEVTLTGMPLEHLPFEEVDPSKSICKLMFIDPEEEITRIMKEIPEYFHDRYNIVRSAPFFLEFLNKDASKGLTLKNLAEKLAIDPSEIMAIGDNENDISMLEYAGLGVAMGNATEKTKEYAQKITLSNDEDGVAYALENFTK